jgi:hypothetical protein
MVLNNKFITKSIKMDLDWLRDSWDEDLFYYGFIGDLIILWLQWGRLDNEENYLYKYDLLICLVLTANLISHTDQPLIFINFIKFILNILTNKNLLSILKIANKRTFYSKLYYLSVLKIEKDIY